MKEQESVELVPEEGANHLDPEKLRAAYKGVPSNIQSAQEMFEAVRQREIEGYLNDKNHLPLVEIFTKMTPVLEFSEISSLTADGRLLFIACRMNGYPLPLYLKHGNKWTLNFFEAMFMDNQERVVYWWGKMVRKYDNKKWIRAIYPVVLAEAGKNPPAA